MRKKRPHVHLGSSQRQTPEFHVYFSHRGRISLILPSGWRVAATYPNDTATILSLAIQLIPISRTPGRAANVRHHAIELLQEPHGQQCLPYISQVRIEHMESLGKQQTYETTSTLSGGTSQFSRR